MRGVRVPAGHHRIEFSYHPYRAELLVALGALAVLAAWAAWRVRPRRAGEKL
jgi:hypothetical protein